MRGHEPPELWGREEGRGGVPTVMKILRQGSRGAPKENHRRAAHHEEPVRGVAGEGGTTPGQQEASDPESQDCRKKAGACQTGTDDSGRESDGGSEDQAGEGGTVRMQ